MKLCYSYAYLLILLLYQDWGRTVSWKGISRCAFWEKKKRGKEQTLHPHLLIPLPDHWKLKDIQKKGLTGSFGEKEQRSVTSIPQMRTFQLRDTTAFHPVKTKHRLQQAQEISFRKHEKKNSKIISLHLSPCLKNIEHYLNMDFAQSESSVFH